MSEAQQQAQQGRRQREREAAAAAAAANAAADAIPDEAVQAMQSEIAAGSVADNDPVVIPKPDHSVRLGALEEIRKARAEDRDEEAEEPAGEPIPAATAEQAQPAASPGAEPAQAAAPAVAPQPETVDVIVDRQHFTVPKADVDAEGGIVAYQINRAAENRLRKAAELARQNAEAAAVLHAKLNPPAPQKSVDDLIKEKIQIIQFGAPDEAAAAYKEIFAAQQQPAQDPAKLKQEAVEAVFEHMAAQSFIQRNQDILNNRTVAQLALLTQNDMIAQQGRPQDWNKFYETLEGQLRNTLGKPSPVRQAVATQTTPQPTSGTVADKEARKASIVALPVASARAQAPEEQKPKTREQVLADMRRARGQPV